MAMKKFRVVLMALLLCMFSAGAALAQDIQVVNGCSFEIQRLGLADASASGMQDLLGDSVLPKGNAVTITISGSPVGWSLMAQDDEGNNVAWQNLDLTGASQITLHDDGTISGQ